ncbi:hypothetical protein ACPYO6_12660 [Georgenia sp. Z1344]|uniref:hypothetical protein n=1 Tax=Georgenia sp. Z1344 TaxID=3416706 RepID=UPI003CFA8092
MNVVVSVLMNPSLSEAVLRSLVEARPDMAESIARKKNAPLEVIEAQPVNRIGAAIVNYMWRIGADDDLWRRFVSAQRAHPPTGGPPLGEITREYRIRHERDEVAHRAATARHRAMQDENWHMNRLHKEVVDPATPLARLLEIARDDSMYFASAVLAREPLPVEVLAVLRELHPHVADEAERIAARSRQDPPLAPERKSVEPRD